MPRVLLTFTSRQNSMERWRLVDQRPAGSRGTAAAVVERFGGIDAMGGERWLAESTGLNGGLYALLDTLADCEISPPVQPTEHDEQPR